MAKRFIDTGFYRSPYVRSLDGPLKALYSFIICDCSGSGIWIKDLEIASIFIGFPISEDQWQVFVRSGKAVEISAGRFFFPDFIEHQYPNGLNRKNVAHNNFLEELLKFNLLEEVSEGAWKPLQRSFKGPMVMVKEEVKVKATETVKVSGPKNQNSGPEKFDLKPYTTIYDEWLKKHSGVGGKFGPAGMKSMKEIAIYLRKQVTDKHPTYDGPTVEAETIRAWEWIFHNFSKWDPFHQGQLKLEQINYNLVNIISSIKNPKQNGKKGISDQHAELDRIGNEARERLAKRFNGGIDLGQ